MPVYSLSPFVFILNSHNSGPVLKAVKADADRRKRGEEIAEAKARARQRRRKGKSSGEVGNSPNAPKVITSSCF